MLCILYIWWRFFLYVSNNLSYYELAAEKLEYIAELSILDTLEGLATSNNIVKNKKLLSEV